MNTRKLFKDFHKKNQEEIAGLVKKFVYEDFFVIYPELKNKASILITGSVASGHYDSRSDIDLTIIFPSKQSWKKLKFVILGEFKNKHLEPLREPLEVHGKNITYFQKIDEDLGSWKYDWMLRELAEALIIHDPKGRFKKIKEKYKWYPKDIFQEKINYIYAESSFLFLERYKTALERSSLFYAEIIKLRILKLFVAALIMANNEYPTYDKHSYDCVTKNPKYKKLKIIIDNIISEMNGKKIFKLFTKLRGEIEKLLISKKFIAKQSDRYWISFRSTLKIDIEGE